MNFIIHLYSVHCQFYIRTFPSYVGSPNSQNGCFATCTYIYILFLSSSEKYAPKYLNITSTIVWPLVKSRERTQLHPSTENWIKDLLSTAPPFRTRPSFPLSKSPPSGSFHKPLILLHQRADRLKTTITEN